MQVQVQGTLLENPKLYFTAFFAQCNTLTFGRDYNNDGTNFILLAHKNKYDLFSHNENTGMLYTGPLPWGCVGVSNPTRIYESMLFGKNEKLVGKFKKC